MPRIVIIGAGAGGITCAQALARSLRPADDIEVVVIDKLAFYYHVVGTPRAFVESAYTPKLFIPFDNAIPKAAASLVRLERALVTEISSNEVAFHRINGDDEKSGEMDKLSFDYLVIATGSWQIAPIKPDIDRYSRSVIEKQFEDLREQISKAEKVLVVGGGAVGCEIAAEIKVKFPAKAVTIVESRDKLIANQALREKFRDKLNHSLEKLQVRVVLGERLEERLTCNGFEKRTLRTDKGTELESDVQLLCAGFRPVTGLVRELDPSLLTESGFIKVNAQLQVDDDRFRHMFVIGDASNHPTPKLAYWASEQAKFLAHELIHAIRGGSACKDKFSKPFPKVKAEAMFLPLGPGGGVGQLPFMGGIVVGDMMVRPIKSKDMMAGMIWGNLGATLPSA